jgi:hypothetical protein
MSDSAIADAQRGVTTATLTTPLTPETGSSPNSIRAAIMAMPAGCVAVVDAMDVTDAGTFGDIRKARS